MDRISVLVADDHPVVTRLRDRETRAVAIDVMKPNQELFRDALKHTHRVEIGGQSCAIPSLEMALALCSISALPWPPLRHDLTN